MAFEVILLFLVVVLAPHVLLQRDGGSTKERQIPDIPLSLQVTSYWPHHLCRFQKYPYSVMVPRWGFLGFGFLLSLFSVTPRRFFSAPNLAVASLFRIFL